MDESHPHEARTALATELNEHDKEDQPSSAAVALGDKYRSLKALALDGLIVFGFGIAGATLVALAFHFRLRPTPVMASLALANLFSYTLGFSLVGTRASDEPYWRRQSYVALVALSISIVTIPFLGLSIRGWALSAIWVAPALGLGGVIGIRLQQPYKNSAPIEIKVGPWKSGKIRLRAMMAAAASVAAILILGTSYIGYVIETKPETAYSSLKLGMTMQQVKFVVGDNPSRVGEFQGAIHQDVGLGDTLAYDSITQKPMFLYDTTGLPNGKHIEDYPMWAYASADKQSILRVDFDPNSKVLIGVSCLSVAYSETNPFGIMSCQDLLGVQDRWSEDAVVKKLGIPTEEKINGEVKLLRYQDLGVQYFLARDHVFMLSLFSTQ